MILYGVVKNENGDRLENVKIELRPLNKRNVNIKHNKGYFTSITNSKGEFTIKKLVEGKYSVVLFAKNYMIHEEQISLYSNKKINFLLKKGKNIEGFVFTKIDGNKIPLSGVQVQLYNIDYTINYFSTKSNSNGKFFLNNLPDITNLVLEASSNSNGRVLKYLSTLAKKIDIELKNSASLIGFVLNSDGSPVPGKIVKLTDVSIDPLSEDAIYFETITNEKGYYFFNYVSSGKFEIVVKGDGALINGGIVELQPGVTSEFNIVLSDGYLLSGVIEDTKGNLVKEVVIQLFGNAGFIAETVSDSEGEFELFDIAPGSYSINIHESNRFKNYFKQIAVNDDTKILIKLKTADNYLKTKIDSNIISSIEYINLELCNLENKQIKKIISHKSEDQSNVFISKKLDEGIYIIRTKINNIISNSKYIEINPGSNETNLDFLGSGDLTIRFYDKSTKKPFLKEILIGVKEIFEPKDKCFEKKISKLRKYHNVKEGKLIIKNLSSINVLDLHIQSFGYEELNEKIYFEKDQSVIFDLQPGRNKHPLDNLIMEKIKK